MKTAAALCAGVGGLELALSRFGVETTWYAETDPDASTVLEKRLEGVPNLGDIRDRATWRTAPVPDILTAGFPCQPISQAGKQRHRGDDRYLWPAVRDAITDMMPATVFLENVQNLVSIDGGSVLAEILADLHRLGYAARWTVLGACAVLLSHHRHRWFLRAERVDSGQPAAARVLAKCGAPPRRRKLMPTPVARDGDPGQRGEGSPEYWAKRRETRPTQGIPLGALLRLLPTPIATDGQGGPREVPAVRTHSGSDHGPRLRDMPWQKLLPTPMAADGGLNRGSSAGNGLRNVSRQIAEQWGEYAWAVQRQIDTTGIAPPSPTEPGKNGSPRLAPPFPEWMMALPGGWVTDLLDRPAALRCIGNGASPIQAAAAWTLLEPEMGLS